MQVIRDRVTFLSAALYLYEHCYSYKVMCAHVRLTQFAPTNVEYFAYIYYFHRRWFVRHRFRKVRLVLVHSSNQDALALVVSRYSCYRLVCEIVVVYIREQDLTSHVRVLGSYIAALRMLVQQMFLFPRSVLYVYSLL